MERPKAVINLLFRGGFDWRYDIFNAGVWASNVDFEHVGLPNTLLEIDVYAGIASTIGPFDYDVGIFYYTYPGNDNATDLEYLEFLPSLSYTFSELPLQPSIYVQYGYSPDYFGEEGDAHNVEGGMALSLPMGFGIDGWVGYQAIDGDSLGTDIEWTYWSLGLTKSVLGFDLDLRYHGETEDTDPAFGPWLANGGFDTDIVTFSISRSTSALAERALAEKGAGIFARENFSGNIALITDYVYRGETQSRNQPVVQGAIEWEYNIFYTGVWLSNVDFDNAGLLNTFLELDIFAGVEDTIGPFDYDLGIYYYIYPGNDNATDLEYFEIIPTLSYTLSDMPLQPRIYVHYAYSPEYFGERRQWPQY